MQKLSTTLFLGAAVAFIPSAASAVTLSDTIKTFSNLINGLIPLLLALAVLTFFWGLAMYMLNAGNTEERSKGINIMVMGIIVIFVMVSIWGIIRILQETFKVEQSSPIIPEAIQRRF